MRTDVVPKSDQDHFVTLDGMRGLAALIVAGSHISELLHIGVPPHAHLAVDFFFVLSGFVISHAYEERLRSSMSPLEFLLIRVVRLHPLILLGSGITLAIFLAGGSGVATTLWAAVAGTLMIPAMGRGGSPAFPLDGPAWSLFAEYAVNLLFALIAISLTMRRLALVLMAGAAMLVALAFSQAGLESYWRSESIGLSLLRVVYPFFAGVLANRLYRRDPGRWPSLSPVLAMMLLLTILLAPSTRFDTVFQFAMIIAAFPLLVLASAKDRLAGARSEAMLLGGKLSYPVYVLHFPLATLLVPVATSLLPAGIALPAILLIVIGVSLVALRRYDEPVRAWLGLRFRQRRVRALAA